MSGELAVSVLRHVLRDVKRRGRLEDAQAQALAALEPAELAELQAATELVARRAVTRVEAAPSGRVFFRVRSLASGRFRRQEDEPADSQADASEAQPGFYTCLEHFCSCSRFLDELAASPVAMCKHMVAALLADATQQAEQLTVQDADFARMLCPPPAAPTYVLPPLQER